MSTSEHANHIKLSRKTVVASAAVPAVILLAACWLPCNQSCPSTHQCLQRSECGQKLILIAQRDQSLDDPHGPDPHGPNAHDEIHDPSLPANKADDARTAPTDQYGGDELDKKEMPKFKYDDQGNQTGH